MELAYKGCPNGTVTSRWSCCVFLVLMVVCGCQAENVCKNACMMSSAPGNQALTNKAQMQRKPKIFKSSILLAEVGLRQEAREYTITAIGYPPSP